MPSFVSNRGKWVPAKEEIGLTNLSDKPIEFDGKIIPPGKPFVYIGPDREAVKELELNGNVDSEGNKHLGKDFISDPDFLQAVRNMGFETGDVGVKKYLELIGYDEKKEKELFESRAENVQAHEIPERINVINQLGGGKDTSGQGKHRYGNFGDPPDIA